MDKIEIIECPICGDLCKDKKGFDIHLLDNKDHPSPEEYYSSYINIKPEIKMDYIIPISNMGGDGFKFRLNNLNTIIRLLPKHIHLIIIEQMLNPVNQLFTRNIVLPKTNSEITKKVVKYPIFNKPWLYNIGVALAKTNNILLGEGDVSVNLKFFIELEKYINSNNKDWFFCWNRIQYWNETRDKVLRDDAPRVGMAEGGIVYFKKDFFWSIGGANEHIQELGGIDNELIRRASFKTKTYDMFKWTIHHMWHPVSNIKKDKWKNGKHRQNNVRIYYFTKSNPDKMIDILNKEKQGKPDKPLCAYKTLQL